MYVRIYMYVYVCTYVRMYVYKCAYIYMCIYIYMYICVSTHKRSARFSLAKSGSCSTVRSEHQTEGNKRHYDTVMNLRDSLL